MVLLLLLVGGRPAAAGHGPRDERGGGEDAKVPQQVAPEHVDVEEDGLVDEGEDQEHRHERAGDEPEQPRHDGHERPGLEPAQVRVGGLVARPQAGLELVRELVELAEGALCEGRPLARAEVRLGVVHLLGVLEEEVHEVEDDEEGHEEDVRDAHAHERWPAGVAR